MQNAGLQYGQGVTPVQESPFGATAVQNNPSNSTSSLRQFRKKDNVDKTPGTGGGVSTANTSVDAGSSSHVARVAPHNHYPNKQNEYFRYPPQYQEYGSPYKEHTVKYSEISEPVPQSIPHLDHLPPSVLSKHKEKEYVDMCNIPQQTHLNKPYPEHQFNGQQAYPPEMALHHQYMHKESQGPQMHSPFKPESQYIPKEGGFNHQISPFLKYNIPQSRSYGPPMDNSSLPPFQRMDPHIARSLMTDHPHMRDFSAEYSPMDQNRMYAQKQRYYPTSLPPTNSTYPPNYPHRNLPAQQYNYPSCNYPRTSQMNSTMGRYPINMERSMSPRRAYAENIEMGINFTPVTQKMHSGYPNYPAYAQHYQHRRSSAVPQEYYHPQQHPAHARPHPQYMPPHHPQDVSENHVASNNIRQYLENWAEEEPSTEISAQIENPKYISRINREEANEVYVINASELPQYLESGVPLVTSENGQYIFKSNVSIDNTGAIKILEKTVENPAVPTDTQDRVVSLHIVENPRTDCLVNTRSSNTNQEQQQGGPNQTATINVITANTNHPNLESSAPHSFNISGTPFNTNRLNLVHQVSPMAQNVAQPTQNYDSSVNVALHPNTVKHSPPHQITRPATLEANLRPSPNLQTIEKPLDQAQKLQVNINNEDVTSEKNRLKIEVLSYNEVPQNSCIVMPSTQIRLNFDESLLPNPVPCDPKETKNVFEVTNDAGEDNAGTPSNDSILNEGHEELDKIVEDTLTSSNINIPLGTCERNQLPKIDQKCDTTNNDEESVNSQIPDDLNLDLESNPKDLTTNVTNYSMEHIEETGDNDDIIDLSTSRRESRTDNLEQPDQCVELDLSVQGDENKQDQVVLQTQVDSPISDKSISNDQEDVGSPKSSAKHMPLIDDNLEVNTVSSCLEVEEKMDDEEPKSEAETEDNSKQAEVIEEKANTEFCNENSKTDKAIIILEDCTIHSEDVRPATPSEELPSTSETQKDILMRNQELDTLLEEKLCKIVGEPTDVPENIENNPEIPPDLPKSETGNLLATITEESPESSCAPMVIETSNKKEEVELPIDPLVQELDEKKEVQEELKEETLVPKISDIKPEKKIEGTRKKRIFSVDDIIYRIGPNLIENRRKSFHYTPNGEIEDDTPEDKLANQLKNESSSNHPKSQLSVQNEEKIEETKAKKKRKETENFKDIPESEKMDITIIEVHGNIPKKDDSSDIKSPNFSSEIEEKLTPPCSTNTIKGKIEEKQANIVKEKNNVCASSANNESSPNEETSTNKKPIAEEEVIETAVNVIRSHLTASEDITSTDRTSEFNLSVHLKTLVNDEERIIIKTENENFEKMETIVNDKTLEMETGSEELLPKKDVCDGNIPVDVCEENVYPETNKEEMQVQMTKEEVEMDTREHIAAEIEENPTKMEDSTVDQIQNLNSLPGCRFSVIQKTDDTTRTLLQEESLPLKVNEESGDLQQKIGIDNSIMIEDLTPDNQSDSQKTSNDISHDETESSNEKCCSGPETQNYRSVIQSTEDTIREDESSKLLITEKIECNLEEKSNIRIEDKLEESEKPPSIPPQKIRKEEPTFEQKFVEPLFNSNAKENPTKAEEIEEKSPPEYVQYRSVLKIEENNVLLEIGGELVEISVNQANGKKVITVMPMSNTATVDFNDNYEQFDRASEEIIRPDRHEDGKNEEIMPILQEETSETLTEENIEKELPVLSKMVSSSEDEENCNESINDTHVENFGNITENSEEIFADIILNENEIIIGDESLEEEINLDLQNTITEDKERSIEDKPILYTKAAKKLYDDISVKIPTKTYSSLREFRRIKLKPQILSEKINQDTHNIDLKEKNTSKRSLRISTRHRSISEQKEESQSALRELIKRRKMRKEKIRLKYTQYAKNESKIVKNTDVSCPANSLKNKEDKEEIKIDSKKSSKAVVKTSTSAVKKIKASEDAKIREVKKIRRDQKRKESRKKFVQENKQLREEVTPIVIVEQRCALNLVTEKKKVEEKPTSTSVVVSSSIAPEDTSAQNFRDARTATSTAVSKNVNVQDKQSRFPKISTPRDLSLTKNVNEHYLSRKDHSNLKKKLSIQEYNSRKRKSNEPKSSTPEKMSKNVQIEKESSKEGDKGLGRPSTIYSDRMLDFVPNGLKDPRRRPHFTSGNTPMLVRTQSEVLTSPQTPSISSSRPVRINETSQSFSSEIVKDSLLNLNDSSCKQIQNYKNYKTFLLEKSSVEKCVQKPTKISNRRKTIEVMNERKHEPSEVVKKKVSFDDNVQINEIHTTQSKLVKMKPESLNYCEVSSSCSDLIEDKSSGDIIDSSSDKIVETKKVTDLTKSNRMKIVETIENDWEDSNSPKDSLTDAFADSFLEKSKLESLNKNKNKLIIDINDFDTSLIDNELKSPYGGRFTNSTPTYEDDGGLKNYKEEVDSKLNSLNIQIPKTKCRVVNEDDLLMHKFLRKEQLNSEEIKEIRRIIYFKKKIQQFAQQNVSTKNLESDNYEVRKKLDDISHRDLKLQLKKLDGKAKKKKKRFRNLYSQSPETSGSEILETAGEFSVYEEENLSGVKLIFKRKTDLLNLQPVVRLQRCRYIESMAKKLKFE